MRRRRSGWGCERGQSLIETALVMPLLLLVLMNAVNFGYYCVVALNLNSAARQGAQYSAEGFVSTLGVRQPAALAVKNQAIEDLTSALAGSSTVAVRVCSQQIGVDSATHKASCQSYGSGSWQAVAVDPGAPYFVLNQVDVSYTITPIFPGQVFGITLLPSLTLHRTAYVRSMP